jgi:hypothetical protein
MAYLPLTDLPVAVRAAEQAARQTATDDSGYEIVLRPGCHGQPSDDPPVVGAVETLQAARALCRTAIGQPDHVPLRRYAYRPLTDYGPGTWPADAPTRGPALRASPVTEAEVRALAREAHRHGDRYVAGVCEHALRGEQESLDEVDAILREARAAGGSFWG